MPRFEPNPARRPALVAGASSGIGAATALELASRGFPVALGARRVEKCQELVDQIHAGGGEAVAIPLDVTDQDSVKGFVHRATEELGDIELLLSVRQAGLREVRDFIDREKLYGLRCGLVDMVLLTSTLMTPGARLWSRTRDCMPMATLAKA